MNIFLFRLSRLLSVGIFIIIIGLSLIMIDRTSSIYSEFEIGFMTKDLEGNFIMFCN